MESPSPAPIQLVHAEHISKKQGFSCEMDHGLIKIIYANNDSIYHVDISQGTKFWRENKHLFQGQFKIFKKCVCSSLLSNDQKVKKQIIKEDYEEVILSLKYDCDIFNFDVILPVLQREKINYILFFKNYIFLKKKIGSLRLIM